MRVVVDTNVFISGIFWKGNPCKILELWKEKRFTNVTSAGILSEINTVLNDFEIKLPEAIIKEWIDLIASNSVMTVPKEKLKLAADPSDDKFIEADD